MLKRRTPLRRKTPLNWRRRQPRRQARERNLEYIMWCRRQPCAVRRELCNAAFFVWHSGIPAREPRLCDGHVQADHAGKRGLSVKANDDTCIPLCEKHHTQRASFHGYFKDFDQERMRAWLLEQIAYYQAEYTKHLERTK